MAKISSTDSVDNFTHKWSVLIVVVLSLVSFIIPLHPSYHQNSGSPSSRWTIPPTPQSQAVHSPKVKAVCWAPAEFTLSYIAYANTYCSNALNAAVEGNENVSVYMPMDGPIPINIDPFRISSNAITDRYRVIKQRHHAQNAKWTREREHLEPRVQKLVTFQTPIMLLVIAFWLALPWMIWSLLSECFSSVNVDQTLDSAQQANSLEDSSKKQVYRDLSLSVTNAARSSCISLSILYVVKKVLSLVVIIALLLVVTLHAVPEIKDVNKEVDGYSRSRIPVNSDEETMKAPQPDHPLVEMFKHPNDKFLCDFSIRQLQMVQRWTVTCTVAVEDSATEQNDKPVTVTMSPPTKSSTEGDKNLLEFEMVVFHIVTAILAILGVSNVISLCAWLCKLLSGSSMGLPSNAPRDIVFLVQMARVNASADMAHQLAQAFSGFEEIDDK